MTFRQAIEIYLADMRSEGRLNSDRSERFYYDALSLHADDVANRDPRTTNRNDVKRTIRRWSNPNTQRGRRAVLVSFYDWAMEEGHRKDNPARQTRRPKHRPTSVYRLNAAEVTQLLAATETVLERRAITIGICAGLRSAELLGLKPLHFQRPGFVWVSADIAKGGKERYVPVSADLQPVVDEILASCAPKDYVLHARSGGFGGDRDYPTRPMSPTGLYKLVQRVGQRAGIVAGVHPHLLRHAYCDLVTRHAGLKIAQAVMGHADPGTTQGYTDTPTLDELAGALRHITFSGGRQGVPLPPAESAIEPVVETAGIEPAAPTAPERGAPNIKQRPKGGRS